ncbi:MAG: disulfide bond formation protein DsbA [Acidimicrobiia bacterium]|nr:disulfide bond formation protein DsbA [Acidimicrobiia bacterium]
MAQSSVQHVTFFFDPACPWTWRTSRWVVHVTARRSIPLGFRAFDLSDGEPVDTMPERYRPAIRASRGFLRAIEQAHADGGDDIVGPIYAAYGALVHDGDVDPSPQLVREVFAEHGGGRYLDALDDTSLDKPVAAARAEAQEFSGDDTGSPVIVLQTTTGDFGVFGPVLAPTPTGADADRVWDGVVALATTPEFFELKRRRTADPTG